MLNFPPCPAALRRISFYLKTAEEHANRDIVVTYWCCLYALQTGLKISTKTSEETSLLIGKISIQFNSKLLFLWKFRFERLTRKSTYQETSSISICIQIKND